MSWYFFLGACTLWISYCVWAIAVSLEEIADVAKELLEIQRGDPE